MTEASSSAGAHQTHSEGNQKDKKSTRRGVGAQAEGHRREFRRFRKPRQKIEEESAKQKDIEKLIKAVNVVDIPTDIVEESVLEKKKKKPKIRVCRYFNSKKGCKLGEECTFRHVVKIPSVLVEENQSGSNLENVANESQKFAVGSEIVFPPNMKRQQIVGPLRISCTREEIGTEAQQNARNSELSYFKKRYRNCGVLNDEEGDKISFRYDVIDPEWVFDAKVVHLVLRLHASHPVEQPAVLIPADANKIMPEILRSTVESSINGAIAEKYNVFEKENRFEVIGKLLIRWIDRNLLKVFIEGLKKTRLVIQAEAAGISLVLPATNNEGKTVDVTENDPSTTQTQSEVDSDQDAHEDSADSEQNEESLPIEMANDEKFCPEDQLPIEVTLAWQNISRQVASLSPLSLHIASHCSRCQTEHSSDVIPNDKSFGWRCSRCAQAQSIRLRSSLVHENSAVLAMLDARGCRPIDCVLLRSRLSFVCLQCDKEDQVQNMNYGTGHKSWCLKCHASIDFMITAIRFRGDFSRVAGEDSNVSSSLPKPKKKIEKLAPIQEGQPLPDNGTCKHYKKSYRWFRFPCCGKVFPCDVCHEVADMGHEMKIANRMICGHCSKEQPYMKEKPCSGCEGAMVRGVKSKFWEGGKGCRDQRVMSKNDGRKFTNSRKKTVAKTAAPSLLVKNKK